MERRNLWVTAAFLILTSACAFTRPVSDKKYDSIIGLEGYFIELPTPARSQDSKIAYHPCVKSKVIGVVNWYGMFWVPFKGLRVQNGDKTYDVERVGQTELDDSVLTHTDKFRKYFVETLPFDDMSKNGGMPSPAKTACAGKVWPGMSQELFLFVNRRPYRVNRSGGSFGTHEQWIYGSDSSFIDNTYYYFRNGRLSSWQF